MFCYKKKNYSQIRVLVYYLLQRKPNRAEYAEILIDYAREIVCLRTEYQYINCMNLIIFVIVLTNIYLICNTQIKTD